MDELVIPLPERLGRRLSFGPFEDPRDLLKFLLWAAGAGLLALLWGVVWAIPLLGLGAVFTLLRRGEDTWGDLAARYVSFQGRRLGERDPRSPCGVSTADAYQDPVGGRWEIWRSAPLPISGRSRAELQASALQVVRLLGRRSEEAILTRLPEPWRVDPWVPPRSPGVSWDGAMREGYATLLRRATRDRCRSTLYLAMKCSSPEGPGPLLEQAGWARVLAPQLERVVPQIFPATGWRARRTPT